MPSELQRVAQALIAALDEAPRIADYLRRTAHKCRENAAYVGHMSNHPAAQLAATQLDEAARRCEEAAHYLAQAPPKARDWAEQMANGTRNGNPSLSKRRKGSPQQSTPDTELLPRRMSDDEVRGVLERLPTRKPGDKTRGVWREDDGTEHDLISGRHDDDFTAARRHAEKLGLVRQPHGITTAADVELKFAMRMRRQGIQHAEIVLNNQPCEGPLSCDELLDRFLPDGASLTIYGPNDFKRTYPKNQQHN